MTVRVKICGITRVEDARAAIAAGADMIGLNFYVESPRYVEVDRAIEIRAAIIESRDLAKKGKSKGSAGKCIRSRQNRSNISISKLFSAAGRLRGRAREFRGLHGLGRRGNPAKQRRRVSTIRSFPSRKLRGPAFLA